MAALSSIRLIPLTFNEYAESYRTMNNTLNNIQIKFGYFNVDVKNNPEVRQEIEMIRAKCLALKPTLSETYSFLEKSIEPIIAQCDSLISGESNSSATLSKYLLAGIDSLVKFHKNFQNAFILMKVLQAFNEARIDMSSLIASRSSVTIPHSSSSSSTSSSCSSAVRSEPSHGIYNIVVNPGSCDKAFVLFADAFRNFMDQLDDQGFHSTSADRKFKETCDSLLIHLDRLEKHSDPHNNYLSEILPSGLSCEKLKKAILDMKNNIITHVNLEILQDCYNNSGDIIRKMHDKSAPLLPVVQREPAVAKQKLAEFPKGSYQATFLDFFAQFLQFKPHILGYKPGTEPSPSLVNSYVELSKVIEELKHHKNEISYQIIESSLNILVDVVSRVFDENNFDQILFQELSLELESLCQMQMISFQSS